MSVPEGVVKYVVDGIEGTPAILDRLLRNCSNWDARLSPDRFSLREMIAHLADWDPIFIDRITRTRAEDKPFLPSVDEGALALDRSYVDQDPDENLTRLRGSRPHLVSLLRSLAPSEWERTAHRELVGDVTMFQLATMILGHDAYHIRQALDSIA